MLQVLSDSAVLHDQSLPQHSHQSAHIPVVWEHLASCPWHELLVWGTKDEKKKFLLRKGTPDVLSFICPLEVACALKKMLKLSIKSIDWTAHTYLSSVEHYCWIISHLFDKLAVEVSWKTPEYSNITPCLSDQWSLALIPQGLPRTCWALSPLKAQQQSSGSSLSHQTPRHCLKRVLRCFCYESVSLYLQLQHPQSEFDFSDLIQPHTCLWELEDEPPFKESGFWERRASIYR